MTHFVHEPVLPQAVLQYLPPAHGTRYIDGTVGGGGHAELLLQHRAQAFVLGLDCDEEAVTAARERLRSFSDRCEIRHANYADFRGEAEQLGWQGADGILLDLGVSSHQLDTAARGFSHRHDGPLDMRMNRRNPRTAARILNRAPREELERIFREYGEERRARALARAVVRRREERPWARTADFAELTEEVVGRSRHGPPPATRAFQALRIAVNDELRVLRETLAGMVDFLHPGGRLVVISFHSLEDRIVKHFFRYEAAECVCPPGMPECRCEKVSRLQVLTPKPVRPDDEELSHNRRSAPARLRAAEKLECRPRIPNSAPQTRHSRR